MAYLWTTLASASVLTLSLLTQYPPDPAVPAHPGGGATSQPATQPSEAPAAGETPAGVLAPDNDAVLDTALAAGNRIKVQGSVASASWARSGAIMYVNFNDSAGTPIPRGKGVVAVLFQSNKAAFDKAFDGDFAKALEGKKIEVVGRMTTYRGRENNGPPVKQIVLENPSQVTILK